MNGTNLSALGWLLSHYYLNLESWMNTFITRRPTTALRVVAACLALSVADVAAQSYPTLLVNGSGLALTRRAGLGHFLSEQLVFGVGVGDGQHPHRGRPAAALQWAVAVVLRLLPVDRATDAGFVVQPHGGTHGRHTPGHWRSDPVDVRSEVEGRSETCEVH